MSRNLKVSIIDTVQHTSTFMSKTAVLLLAVASWPQTEKMSFTGAGISALVLSKKSKM